MNKTLKKALSLVLCVLIAFSSLTLSFAADGEENAPSLGAQYFLSTSNKENAGFALDYIDGILNEKGTTTEVVILEFPKVSITVDLKSVNGVCRTIDTFAKIFNNAAIRVGAKLALGDIGNLDLSKWKTNLSRPADDVEILYSLIDLVAANSSIISKVVDNSIDLGVLKVVFDLNQFLGEDGVSGIIKGLFVGFVHNKQNEPDLYNAAYQKAVGDFDAFIFEDLLPKAVEKYLPELKLSKGVSVDKAFSAVFESLWNAYIEKAIKSLNIPTDVEALKTLGEIMEFKGENIDLSALPFDSSKGLKSQLNNILRYIAGQFFPKFTGWTEGTDVKLISSNFMKLYNYVTSHLKANSDYFANKDVTPVELLRYILENISGEEAEEFRNAVKNSKDLKDAAKPMLIIAAKKNNIPVNEKAASYENVLGDYLTYAANIILDLGYGPGSGKNVWLVANDVLNIYLFDKGFAKALNLNVKKTDSCFEKLDKIIGTTKLWSMTNSKTQYKSEEFFKGLLNSLFNFRFDTALDYTVVRFLNDFEKSDISVLLYNVVYNFLENWFGTPAIVKCDSKAPFQTGFSNKSLKTPIEKVLPKLSEKKATIVPPFLFVAAIVIENFLGDPTPVDVTNVTVKNQPYTGKAITPSEITVTVNGKKVTIPSYQFDANLTSNTGIGTATGTVKLNGAVKDCTVDVSFKIVPATVTGLKAVPGKNSVSLSWNKANGAAGYCVEYYNGSKWVSKSVSEPKATITGLKAGTVYKFRVKATAKPFDGAYSSVISASTKLAKVTGIKTKARTATSVTLTWNKAVGAKKYEVQILKNGKWVTVRSVTENKILVGKNYIKPNKTYKFRVRALGTSAILNGDYSDTATACSGLNNVQKLTASRNAKSVKLSWKKVAGAASYEVQVQKGKKWVTVSTVKKPAAVIGNKQLKKAKLTLNANTAYRFRVRAVKTVSKVKIYSAYSTVRVAKAK